MDDYMRIPPRVHSGALNIPPRQNTPKAETSGFEKILRDKLQTKELKISAHAKMRMNMRNINLSSEDMKALCSAVDKAEQKGVKSSLILMKDNAFVVSVKNRTLITAMDGESMKDNVFTNIDGAVIL
jgi:flagellar operon protein